MKRTHTCGELTIKNLKQKVVLQGWVAKIRKLGTINFVDLRDRYGITQLVIKNELVANIKSEYVIEIEGLVIERKSKNKDLATGEIEIEVTNLQVINASKLTPFEIKDQITSSEETRLQHRYLDLRRPEMQQKLILRSQINHIIRSFFVENNFIEIETPIFGKSTPEGARDFLVPSRLNKNKFYALPQSPQLYKQLFMISGFDRYFQIVKCFRDEDLRIDRQPEFTQLDMEMSFADQEDVISIFEKLFQKLFKQVKNIDLKVPFRRMTWEQAIDLYGIDKPDLRFGLEIKTLNSIFEKTSIPLFKDIKNKSIRAICVNDLLNKKSLEALTEEAKQNGINILSFAKFDTKDWTGSIGSKLSTSEKEALLKLFAIKGNATILFVVDEFYKASQAMGAIRNKTANILNLVDANKFEFLWVVDFPLFEYSEEEKRFVAKHHPFTMPNSESIDTFDKDKQNAKANAYDIVLNGFEIGGGSQRITNPEIQERMFNTLELDKSTIETNFGWFMEAYKYGAPYHSGCALGLDRLYMLLTNSDNIREVIAFPKNSSGIDPMSNAPGEVTKAQLDEVNISINKK
ncbi:aspartate--tRNA ligase [Spiroplasma endosymbiont of Crioceris asparagi]|uniref:aspartate--tRNA ligase n=1 Tax=Spiroplasma endosymbiont of Crioceris asparagi TaxID=3066286 RepID=UPI0030CD2BF9